MPWVTYIFAQAQVGDLAVDQRLRHDADHLAAGAQRGVRHRAHQPDRRAAVDDTDALLGQQPRGRLRRRQIGRVVAEAGAAVDAEDHGGRHRIEVRHHTETAKRLDRTNQEHYGRSGTGGAVGSLPNWAPSA